MEKCVAVLVWYHEIDYGIEPGFYVFGGGAEFFCHCGYCKGLFGIGQQEENSKDESHVHMAVTETFEYTLVVVL